MRASARATTPAQLPDGARQMWQNEFFYLDGEVTLYNNEPGADYDIAARPAGDHVSNGRGGVRYGPADD